MEYFNKSIVFPITILLIALAVIYYQFPNIPQNLSFDELEFAKLAVSLNKQPVLYSNQATGHTTPYFFLILFFFKLLGINTLALRLPAAIFGVINSLLVFVLLKQYFKDRAVFLGTFLFVTFRWVFQFTRFSFEASYLLFWELSALLAVINFNKTKQVTWFIISLLSTIMAFYSYLPGRLFFIIPLLYLIINKLNKKYLITFALLFSLSTLPLLSISGTMESRVQNLSYLSSNKGWGEKTSLFAQNITKNLLMFSFQGDLNGRHNYPGKPALNLIQAGLLMAGLFILVKTKIKKFQIFLYWGVLSILPTLFTYPNENPHFLRTYTLTVPVILITTIFIDYLLKRKQKIVTLALVSLILLSALYEIRTYFYYQTQVFPKAFENQKKDLEKLKF